MAINRNPLGIRKLDVQRERREYRRQSRTEASRLLSGFLLSNSDDQLIRCVATALQIGWEDGCNAGAKATRDRVAESLANGKLVKR